MKTWIDDYAVKGGKRWRVRWELPPGPERQRRMRSRACFARKGDAAEFVKTLHAEQSKGRVVDTTDVTVRRVPTVLARRVSQPIQADHCRGVAPGHRGPRAPAYRGRPAAGSHAGDAARALRRPRVARLGREWLQDSGHHVPRARLRPRATPRPCTQERAARPRLPAPSAGPGRRRRAGRAQRRRGQRRGSASPHAAGRHRRGGAALGARRTRGPDLARPRDRDPRRGQGRGAVRRQDQSRSRRARRRSAPSSSRGRRRLAGTSPPPSCSDCSVSKGHHPARPGDRPARSRDPRPASHHLRTISWPPLPCQRALRSLGACGLRPAGGRAGRGPRLCHGLCHGGRARSCAAVSSSGTRLTLWLR